AALAQGDTSQFGGPAYKAPYNYGVLRGLESKLADIINIKDFGARCDGSDETTILNRAISAAAQKNVGRVAVPLGCSTPGTIVNPTGVLIDDARGTPPAGFDYTCSSPGCVTRSATSKFSDATSVKDFGGRGDGVTIDFNALQACLTA